MMWQGQLFWSSLSSLTRGNGSIQVLRNAVGGGMVSDIPEKSITKMYSSTLLVLRGGGWVYKFPEKSFTKHLNVPNVLVF